MPKDPKLAAYSARRDFQKTAEPAGDDAVRASNARRFVVQRHDATRLHFDLRLELDGVFRSWAVTKGPSLNPADKRLAVEVEDHPLGYGDFEGTIPKGQYGGGTVQLFDRGTWAPQNGDPVKALADGELKFALDGERLAGGFVLVRLKQDRRGGKRTNWLLIKHRDAAANDAGDGGGLLKVDRSVASGRAMRTIAAGKGKAPTPFMLGDDKAPAADAVWDSSKGHARQERDKGGRVGSKAGTATDSPKQKLARTQPAKRGRAKPKADSPMPDFIAPQLCAPAGKPPSGQRWLHEIKFDGYRIQARIEGRHVALRTRTGLDWTDKFPAVAKAARGLPDAILDGEVVALDTEGRPDFPSLQAALAAETTDALVFFVFDLLFLEGEDLRKQPLEHRKTRLEEVLAGRRTGKRTLRYVEHFAADGPAVYASALEMGLEGIVSKRVDAAYRSGRADSWTKAKGRPTHEVVLGGWTDTDGKFRSLVGGVFGEDDKLAYVGRIGTGFSQTTIERLMPKLKAHARAKSPFDGKTAPPRVKNVHWLEPVLVAEIEFAGWSTDGSVRQAAFKRLREDKPAAEVATQVASAPPPVTAPQPAGGSTHGGAAESGKSRSGTAKSGKVVVMGVTLSHPDKALWPDAGDDEPVTKRDLALYLEAVGDWMLPHLEGRPCSIIRAPDGIEHQTFFQRHAMPGGSDLFDEMKVLGEHAPYLVVNRVEALAAVAQSGGLELHPSNGVPGDPLVPGRLVFDLDPAPDVAFADVVAAAKELRVRLEALGLVTFCKTTGGKGLHVVTPVVATGKAADWKVAKRFAQDVCTAMERDAPKRYLTKMSKAARSGRIFLDYLRNDRISTAVAVLSPRARPHAPVSMPLTWAQARADLDPSRFTVRSVPGLLNRSKAWSDYADAARPLAEAIAAAGRR